MNLVKRYSYSPIISTGAVIKELLPEEEPIRFFALKDGVFSYRMSADTRIYGLGEAVRGINKRGWVYEGYCTDDPGHTEDKLSLYGAHNFLLIDGKERFGVFFDYPGRIRFDIGYTDPDMLTIQPKDMHLDVYLIEGERLIDIAADFRGLIGRSYIAPFWAFGFGQSRWGYCSRKDIENTADRYQQAGIPIDMIYLDIDYMESFKDFTVSEERFPDFKNFVMQMKERGIRLIPIIDAAVKKEEGYDVYDEGHEKRFFCTGEDGEDYVVGVWPGMSCLPDFINPDASGWFGEQYQKLTDLGIEGFWNDMNEPALFYSEKGLERAFNKVKEFQGEALDANKYFAARDVFLGLANSYLDYSAFYHKTPQGRFCHDEVHNLYGYKMTQSAADALDQLREERSLLFSRASYIGAHRCGGIWTGDNHSWWSHILLSLQQMPGLNLCGFLYTGSDIGGFGSNCTRDLLIRWLSFAIFTPLMRNHSAYGTRKQEAFSFGDTEVFRHIIALRYRLIPYLYSEYMKAALRDGLYFRPLRFDYEDDAVASDIEDQLMVGDRLMIAPIYRQNAIARHIYLPQRMNEIRMSGGKITTKMLDRGWYYIEVPLGDVVFFSRGKLPLADPAVNTAAIDCRTLCDFGEGEAYELYTDDGVSKIG